MEATNVVFAADSIPTIFTVTFDPFIVYTSNIFAILGLRFLYFLLAGVIDELHYLKAGLAFVLAFVGTKILIVESYEIPIAGSLIVVDALLGGSVAASFPFPQQKEKVAVGLRGGSRRFFR